MITIRDLTFEYFDRDEEGNLTEMVNAIRGINFDAGEGEFIVVAGVNGSGKSTFAKILNRLLLPIEGTVLIGGLDAMQEGNIIPIRKMVGMVFQNPDDQLIGSVVEEDVAFGAENIGVPHKELVKRVEDALDQVGLSASMRIEELSGGGKQKVAIAGVLAMKPRCIVLDEATSMLDPKSRRDVLQLMKELQKQGITIILITHLMEELLMADWIYVMHQGRLAMKGSREAIFAQPEKLREFGLELPMTVQLAHALTKCGCVRTKDLFSIKAIAERIYKEHPYAFLKEKTMEPAPTGKKAKALSQAIVLQHVHLNYGEKPILTDVCCSIEKGSYTAIIGPSGAGKSTLLQMIPALISPTDGNIYVDGLEVTDASADIAALRKKIGFIFQYPEQQLFAKNVYEDVVFGPRNVGISEVEAEKRAYEAIQFVGLPQDVYDLPMDKLSGGQKRRVALAGVIAMQPDYLILDEPLAGLDPVGKKKMLDILRALHRDAGITVVVVSHDADAVVEDAEQVLYLQDGKILEYGTPADVFYRLWRREMDDMSQGMTGRQTLDNKILSEALCELPVCMQLLIRLRMMGLPVSCRHTQPAETVQAIVDAVDRL
ncbi:ABC transporter ATP-binding protein [Eubacterium sp. MSJ-33]|uniref:ABC transporter ATP-binding protein n=1 Tax=Eubacterium sp. MSJ-33 TaxID=2841528 RepID=UPI001C781C3F|nr:energy-coupling factor transporter ATPase [Eubacterium sp. MSJ-33]QWT51929.1 ATP-binding cassette domain-containing protein [Eubacterium sp. MSJ-33]